MVASQQLRKGFSQGLGGLWSANRVLEIGRVDSVISREEEEEEREVGGGMV